MSTTETTTPVDADEHVHDHPGDLKYIKVALVLALFTVVEVMTYFVDFGDFHTPVLLVLMVVKFAIVAMFFMHLKFDNRVLTAVFVAGLILAVGVYVAALLTFEFF